MPSHSNLSGSYVPRLGQFLARREGHLEEEFNTLALELFSRQFELNQIYRKFCAARQRTPHIVRSWKEIPAIPVSAFKEFDLTCLPLQDSTAVFHSSGTTNQKRSRHFHNAESLAVYETSLLTWFAPHLLGGRNHNNELGFIFLTPDGQAAPNSSLVHMAETVRRHWTNYPVSFLGKTSADGSWQLDLAKAITLLGQAIRPVLILGTAFLFVELLDYLAVRKLKLSLPADSRVMETGGYKGRTRELPKMELHHLIGERLGIIVRENIVCEYGMSELSSQAYDGVAGVPEGERFFQFPPWARAQVISPETGREVGVDETGLLRIWDLANVASVMALQTEDLAIRRERGFELLGRTAMAEPRGCSLMSLT